MGGVKLANYQAERSQAEREAGAEVKNVSGTDRAGQAAKQSRKQQSTHNRILLSEKKLQFTTFLGRGVRSRDSNPLAVAVFASQLLSGIASGSVRWQLWGSNACPI